MGAQTEMVDKKLKLPIVLTKQKEAQRNSKDAEDSGKKSPRKRTDFNLTKKG